MDIKHNIKRWTGERKKKIEDIFGKQNHMKLMWLLRLNSHIRMSNCLSSTWVSEGCKPEHLDKESKGIITILPQLPNKMSDDSMMAKIWSHPSRAICSLAHVDHYSS